MNEMGKIRSLKNHGKNMFYDTIQYTVAKLVCDSPEQLSCALCSAVHIVVLYEFFTRWVNRREAEIPAWYHAIY